MRSGEPGSARLMLASGVALLRADEAVFDAMLTGWARQQIGGRGLGAIVCRGTDRGGSPVRGLHERVSVALDFGDGR